MRRAAIVLAAAGAVAFGTWWPLGGQYWLAVHTGTVNEAGGYYGFLSGTGSIILPPVLNGLALTAVFWWHHQCYVTDCYRYARRTTPVGDRACWKHHPEKKVTAEDIRKRYHLYTGERPGRG